MSQATSTAHPALDVDLHAALCRGLDCGLQMTGVQPRELRVTEGVAHPSDTMIVVGIAGAMRGVLAFGGNRPGLLHLARALTGNDELEAGTQALDAITEIGSSIARHVREFLATGLEAGIQLAAPVRVSGTGFGVYPRRGTRTLSVVLELPDVDTVLADDRLLVATLSLEIES